MIVGIAGACRTDEFCKMNLAHITDHGQYVRIKIPQTKNGIPRSFTIVENPDGERVSYVNYFFLGTFVNYYKLNKINKYNRQLTRIVARIASLTYNIGSGKTTINVIQGDFESCADILITSYWLHVELGKNI
jgi:hypothetical protein